MAEGQVDRTRKLLYHFCRLRLPDVALPPEPFERHLGRAFALYRAKQLKEGGAASWDAFLENLHAVDWFLASACLEGEARAWETLFAARASRSDCLLVDALRLHAVRLFPRDQERQDEAVAEFWGYLLAGERDGAVPILARYDGQRPLVPWLIRVFRNKHLSDLRHGRGLQPLPDDDLNEADLPFPQNGDAGNVSRQPARLRDRCLDQIGEALRQQGWTGDDLGGFVLKEMDSLLLDEPRLSADRLAALLAARGKEAPQGSGVRSQGSGVRSQESEAGGRKEPRKREP